MCPSFAGKTACIILSLLKFAILIYWNQRRESNKLNAYPNHNMQQRKIHTQAVCGDKSCTNKTNYAFNFVLQVVRLKWGWSVAEQQPLFSISVHQHYYLPLFCSYLYDILNYCYTARGGVTLQATFRKTFSLFFWAIVLQLWLFSYRWYTNACLWH